MRFVSSCPMMKNISGRVELNVKPPVSVIIPQYTCTAHDFGINSKPPSCQTMRNTSSHVELSSGREMSRRSPAPSSAVVVEGNR